VTPSDRTGQVWEATPTGAIRALDADDEERRCRPGEDPHACLIVEPPRLGAAHVRHPAVDLATGERCQLLEDVGYSWEQLTAALRKEGAAHMAPRRIA
jgi:hypothetical protein